MNRRGSGILLHITSLPSAFGVGDLGPWAYRFADFLCETKQRFWQILPLNPAEPGHGNSPYHSTSAFAFNPLLISPEHLLQDGLLAQGDLALVPDFPEERVDYGSAISYKDILFSKVCERFSGKDKGVEYEDFCSQNAFWLDDFALFAALKLHFRGLSWTEWPEDLRDRHQEALRRAGDELYDAAERERFLQYLFFRQWVSLKHHCNEKGISIIGDMPFYVVHDSADVWVHPELFNLDGEKRPKTVAGVPPDYFSETGQLWGNPVYRWDTVKETGYDWWLRRLRHNLRLFDFIRVDHFRGFVAYWEVPATEKNAINGKWVSAPAEDFFDTIKREIPHAPIIAEDLGIITPDVLEIMRGFGFPGMKVLIFAFGDDLPTNPYAPHNIEQNSVVYTGTHDNNTLRGWFEKEATPEVKDRFFRYIGREVAGDEVHREFIRLAMMTFANTVIFPMQDLLGLGEEARMNRPATGDDNWQWRLKPDQLTPQLGRTLLEMTEIYGRA